MSTRLDQLQQNLEEIKEQMILIKNEIEEEERKNNERAHRPIRYDAKSKLFTVKVPDPETEYGYTEVGISLTEDQFSELYEEITGKNKGLQELLETIRTQPNPWEVKGSPRNPVDFPPTFTFKDSEDGDLLGGLIDAVFSGLADKKAS